MSQFIGFTIFVSLTSGKAYDGIVANVDGPILTLANARERNTGTIYPYQSIDGRTIVDIEVLDDGPANHAVAPIISQAPSIQPTSQGTTPNPATSASTIPSNQLSQSSHHSSVPAPKKQPFRDPAIISVGRRGAPSSKPPLTPTLAVSQQPLPQLPPQILPSHPPPPQSQVLPSHPQSIQHQNVHFRPTPVPPISLPFHPIPPQIQARQIQYQSSSTVSPITTKVPVEHPSLSAGVPVTPTRSQPQPESQPQPQPQIQIQPNEQSPTINRPPFTTSSLVAPFSKFKLGDAVDSSAFEETDDPSQGRLDPRFNGKKNRRGRGFSDASHHNHHHTQKTSHGRMTTPGSTFEKQRSKDYALPKRKHKNHSTSRDEDGWATEDVTDIKDQEFDFQGNLDRFDKKTVFSQIEAEDTTAAEERLVSFNRRPQKPIDATIPTIRKNFKNSENVLGTYANGISLADRETWNDNSYLKKGGELSSSSSEDEGLDEENSGRSSRRAMSRQSRHNNLLRKASVNVSGRISPNMSSGMGSGGGASKMMGSSDNKSPRPALRLKTSNRPCPVVSPLQMLDVERIAEVDLGLTDDMMTENAGRGIAQIAIQAFGKRLHSANHNALPVVLVFAGNNKSGARAVAAGRHLKNHHVRVLICVLGLEREEELMDNLRRQINIFRNAGGRLAHWNELSYKLQSLDSPPEIIIDGLLGMHVAFDDLRLPDQASLFELVKFANTSKAHIISIDVPSGIDGQSGEVTTLEDAEPFYVKAKFVVCMGAPKTGVRAALQSVGSGWNLYVVDIGIPNTAWRKYGSRRRHGVEFGAEWVSAIEYVI